MRFLLTLLTCAASPSPPDYAVTFEDGAESSETLVCQQTATHALKCMDLRQFVLTIERLRLQSEAEKRRQEELREKLDRHEVEL